MGLAGLVQYNLYFADNGVPKTGLTPVALLRDKITTTYVSGLIAEVGNGFYTLYTSGTTLTGTTVVGYVDGQNTSLANSDRFIPVTLTEWDYALDTFVSDVPSLTAGKLDANHGAQTWVTSGIETILNAMEGTGFSSSSDSLKALSAAISAAGPVATVAIAGVLVSGTNVSGSYADTASLNSVYWQTTPNGSTTLDQYLVYYAGVGKIANSVRVYGRCQVVAPTAGKGVNLWAWNYTTNIWDSISTAATRINGQTGTTDNTYTYPLLAAHMSIDGYAKIRFTSATTTATSNLYLDYAPFYYQTTGSTAEDIANAVYAKMKYTVYGNGVWLCSFCGSDGTEIGTNGLYNNPCRTYADAMTIAAALNIKQLYMTPDSTIALTQSHANWKFDGMGNILLNGQDISDAIFTDSELISGVSAGEDAYFDHATVGDVTLGGCCMHNCEMKGTVTTVASGEYLLKDCTDGIPGESNPTISAAANALYGLRNWSGGINVGGMTTGNQLMLDGRGKLYLNAGSTGGEIRLRGNFDVTDNVVGGFASVGTFTDDANFKRSQTTTQVRGAVTADHGVGIWTSGTYAVPTIQQISAQLTADHGVGVWTSGAATVVDANAIALAVDILLAANHGRGIWVSGTATVVDNAAIATAVSTQLTADHGGGIWTSGSTAIVDNWAIADAVNQTVTANHGYGIWVSGTGSAVVDNAAIAAAVNLNLTANHGEGIWTSGTATVVDIDAIALAVEALLSANHGQGVWVSGTATVIDNVAIATAVSTQLTADHGVGVWTSGSTAIVDNWAIADAVNQILNANHGYGIWVSGTGSAVVDNEAIAAAVNQVLTANHGEGIWTSGTATVVDNAAIAVAVNAQLAADHGVGIWTSGTYSIPTVQQISSQLTADHGEGVWTSGTYSIPTVQQIAAQITADHGVGIWVSGLGPTELIDIWAYATRTLTADGNLAIAQLANALITANHGQGIWTSGTATVVDNDAIATAVNLTLTANHGAGIWVSGSTATVDNNAIAIEVNTVLSANHGKGIWVSGTAGTGATAAEVWYYTDRQLTDAGMVAIASGVNALLSGEHGSGTWDVTTGSGANVVTLTVVDTAAAPIAGVTVYVYNSAETTLISYGTTSSLGTVGLLLDNGTYKVRLAKLSVYTFTNPQTLTVSGATTATYTGTLISPSPPPTPETCVVVGRCEDGEGNILEGVSVQAHVIGSRIVYQDDALNKVSISSQFVRTTSNASGVWTLTLIRSAHLYDSSGTAGVKYQFVLKGKGLDEKKDAAVPDAATVLYESL